MISSAEARLGRTMSIWVVITAILSLVVGFVLIGPDTDGYSEQWGLLNGVVNFASNFAQVAMLIFAIKLFNIDDDPFLKLLSYITIVGVSISVIMSISPAAHAAGGWTGDSFTPTEIGEMEGAVTYGTWFVFPVWVLLVSLKERGGNLLPSWGSMAGIGASALILVVNFVFLLSLLDDNLTETIIPFVWIVGGVILYPTFAFGVSKAFESKI
ncbi:MAG: hypothetical protein CL606_03780 [Anaerolineaceae bacterium]|nr:hypothetical protein [Anaerolineaceae bacterium]|tara:strand:- start:917 stop:1552 length:636 start_codon:yes stop_codon:yes gene_type:complete